MKQRSTNRQGRGEGDKGGGNTNNTTQKKQRSSARLIGFEGGVATRTRRQTKIQASPLTGTLLRPLLVKCLDYLDEESIRRVCLASKHYHALIHKHPKLKHKFVALLEIRSSNTDGGERPIPKLVQNLYHHRDRLQCYHKIKIIGKIHDDMITSLEFRRLADKIRLQGVVALDMSLPVRSSCHNNDLIYRCFSLILPNLRELDLSNTCHYGHGSEKLRRFFDNCSCLEKLTWTNINWLFGIATCGVNWMNCTSNLKELYMDDSVFFDSGNELMDGRMSDLEDEEHAGIFWFYECTSKVLERVSIKNAKYVAREQNSFDELPIPQTALIKYVRNAPTSLRWFRSDLSDENIKMLQNERPDIEFTN